MSTATKQSQNEWREANLGEFIKSISDTYRFSPNEEVVFLNTSDVYLGKVLNNKLERSDSLPGQAKKRIKKGDFLFSEIRPANGRYALIDFEADNYVVSTKLMVLRCNPNIEVDFFRLFITSKENLEQLQKIAEDRSGTFPQITFDHISAIEISLPPLHEQRAIAEVLGSLDDKIDLLHRQNATLERMAETLVRKSSVEEADEGREMGIFDDVVSMKGGTTPSTSEPKYWDGNICWTSPRDLSNTSSIFLFDTTRKITVAGLKQISSGLLPIGTLLLSSRAPIGYLALTEIPVAINQGYIAIICDKIVSNYFMFLWCKANMEIIENSGNGSVFQEISKSAFRKLEFLIPPTEKLEDFDNIVKPIFQKIKSNQTQIRTLTALRDTLLPKLMSGEVRLVVEEA